MPDESAQNPAENKQPKRIDLPIAGKIVGVKGKDGLIAKKQGNDVVLDIELPVKADMATETIPGTTSRPTSNDQSSAATTAPPASSPTIQDENKSADEKQTDPNIQSAQKNENRGDIKDKLNEARKNGNSGSSGGPSTDNDQQEKPDTSIDPTSNQDNSADKTLSPHEKQTDPNIQSAQKNENRGDIKDKLNEARKNGNSGSSGGPSTDNDQQEKPTGPTDNATPPTDEQPEEKEGAPEGQKPTQPVNEQNPKGKESENQPTTPPAGQPAQTKNTPLTPEQQREAGQDLKKTGKKPAFSSNVTSAQDHRGRPLDLQTGKRAYNKGEAGKRIKDAGLDILDNTKNRLSKGAKNKMENVANSFRTTKMKKRKLLRDIDKINRKIATIQGNIRSLKASRELRILKFFFPSLYNKIAGITEVTGDTTQKIKVTKLESQVTSLRIAKISLKTAQGAAAVLDAIMTTVRLAAELIETIVGTIIVILLSPIIILILTMVYFVIGGKFSKAFKELVAEINKILKPLEKTLGVERKKLNLMNQRKAKREEIATLETQEKQEKQGAQQTGQGAQQTGQGAQQTGQGAQQTGQGAQQTGQGAQPATSTAPTTGPAPAQPEQNKLAA